MATQWFYTQNNQQLGPIGSQQLKDLAANGTLSPTDLVWNEKLTEWVAASKVKGLEFRTQSPTTPFETVTESGSDIYSAWSRSVSPKQESETTAPTDSPKQVSETAPANVASPLQVIQALLIGYGTVGVVLATVLNVAHRVVLGNWFSVYSLFSYTLVAGTAVGILGLYIDMVTDDSNPSDGRTRKAQMPDESGRLFRECAIVGLPTGAVYGLMLSSIIWGLFCGMLTTFSVCFGIALMAKRANMAVLFGMTALSLVSLHLRTCLQIA